MDSVILDDVTLEYEVTGAGEPLLLVSPMLADGFRPLVSEPALADRFQLIPYHKRGWGGSTHTPPPVSIRTHAADAAALLDHLGLARAHVAGHSSGAVVAAQLALDDPGRVQTLILLEPSFFSLPAGRRFLEEAQPVVETYASGDAARAVEMLLSAISGLEWPACRALLDERLPGAVAGAIDDVDTIFGVELPALVEWEFGPRQARAIEPPVLSLVGEATQPLWIEIAEFLRSYISRIEEVTIDGLGHLLQIERAEPVAGAIAAFVERNLAISSSSRSPETSWSAAE